MSAALRADGLRKVFPSASGEVIACDGVDLTVAPGELVVVRGPSGAGKSTLLNMLGTLETPTAGRVWVGDTDATTLNEDELATLRRDDLGFIFQSFGLIPVLSARENVELPLRIAGVSSDERQRRVGEALDRVGLGGHAEQRPAELSGGQQQRVAIARAIVAQPTILIADEPTGQLDSRTAATIMDLLSELAHDQNLAAIVSTHDPLLVARADRVLELHDGRIVASGVAEVEIVALGGADAAPQADAVPQEPNAAPEAEGARRADAVLHEADAVTTAAVPRTRAEAKRLAQQTGGTPQQTGGTPQPD